MLGQLIVVLLVTNLSLFFVLRLVFSRQADMAINRLKKLHQENLDREAELRREYESAQEEHRKEVERGRQEALKIKEAAMEDVNRMKQDITSQAREEAAGIITSGKKEAELYQQKARQELEKKAIELSLELVKSTFSGEAVESLHRRFVDEIVGLIDKLDDPRLRIQSDEVKISAAFTIEEKQKAALLECLNRKTGRSLRFEIKIDEDIIAGLIINLGELILDASLKNRLKRAAQQLSL